MPMTISLRGKTMPFCIQDILDNATLRTRVLAGSAGSTRALRWAHVCELTDPSEWLGEGDLLMTTGMGIPKAPQEQTTYLQRLYLARVAGIMIGENMLAPGDLSALLDAADASGIPVLMTHYSVPFSAVTRAIIDATRQEEHERRSAVARVYESARIGLQGLGLPGLLKRLAVDTRSELYLFDALSLEPWQTGITQLPPAWRGALAKRRDIGDSVSRCHAEGKDGLVMALPSLARCKILAIGSTLIDYGLLHHLVAVLGIELERIQADHQRLLRIGSELLDDLIQVRISEQAASERLVQLDCPAQLACIACARPTQALPAHWQEGIRRNGVNMLIRSQGNEVIVLLANGAYAGELQAQLGCSVGVSDPLDKPSRTTEALREARLALAHCTDGRPLVEYVNAQDEQSWLPASLQEAERVHRRILGSLIDYDAQQGGQLQRTLRVFLELNRSWQKASERLNVHKQTLVYRVRRIEEVTGRSLDSTEDVTLLWIALRAAQIAGIQD